MYHFHPKVIDSIFGISSGLLAFISTSVLGVLAIFGKNLRDWLFKPNILPVEGKTTLQKINNESSFYYRFIVKNAKRKDRPWRPYQAEKVRVFLTYKDISKNPYFIPIPLRWTHFNDAMVRDIPPQEEVYIDVFAKRDGSDEYEFCWAPTTGSDDPILKNFNPNAGDMRLEFFSSVGKIGDFDLVYDREKDVLKSK